VITFKQRGSFKQTNSFLQRCLEVADMSWLDKYGKMGVEALRNATPVDTGKTANSWDYVIEHNSDGAKLIWTNNSTTKDGDSIAILLQYGHGTNGGGLVIGRDYINPAIQPLFDEMALESWEMMVEKRQRSRKR
jgi:hypothetical protein